MDLKKYLKTIGRKGGLSRSIKKISASRKNGCLGGRPLKMKKSITKIPLDKTKRLTRTAGKSLGIDKKRLGRNSAGGLVS